MEPLWEKGSLFLQNKSQPYGFTNAGTNQNVSEKPIINAEAELFLGRVKTTKSDCWTGATWTEEMILKRERVPTANYLQLSVRRVKPTWATSYHSVMTVKMDFTLLYLVLIPCVLNVSAVTSVAFLFISCLMLVSSFNPLHQ